MVYISVEIPMELIPKEVVDNPFPFAAFKLYSMQLLGIFVGDARFTRIQMRKDLYTSDNVLIIKFTESSDEEAYIECISTIRLVEADLNMLGLLPDRKSRFHYLLNEAMMRNIKP